MRRQRVTRVVDALGGQNRLILWLGCNHKLSLDSITLATRPDLMQAIKAMELTPEKYWDCPFCPDPPPERPQDAKSATQLWREAGEP